MKNPTTDDGLYLLTEKKTDGIVATPFKVEPSTASSWASGRRVLGAWKSGNFPFNYIYHNTTHKDVAENFRRKLTDGVLNTEHKPQPIAFVDNAGIWPFLRLKKDAGVTKFITDVMTAITHSPTTQDLQLFLLYSEEDNIKEAIEKDPDIQAIRDMVSRLGREKKKE